MNRSADAATYSRSLSTARQRRPRRSAVRPVYVTGHRNPDTDSIASAIGYAELCRRLDPRTEYIPVRLGEPNAQTQWVLERAGVDEPRYLPHILLRVRDVMEEEFERGEADESVRAVGLTMAQHGLDLLPTGVALLVMAGWIALFFAPAAATFTKRDLV